MKRQGETMLFSGGAECTPKVVVSRYYDPVSLHNGDVNFKIEQNGSMVALSPETMRAILKWYDSDS